MIFISIFRRTPRGSYCKKIKPIKPTFGRPIKTIITEPITEIKPKVNQLKADQGIREDKIIEYKITNNNIDTRKLKFAQSLIPLYLFMGMS
jgi:hypothetical protein